MASTNEEYFALINDFCELYRGDPDALANELSPVGAELKTNVIGLMKQVVEAEEDLIEYTRLAIFQRQDACENWDQKSALEQNESRKEVDAAWDEIETNAQELIDLLSIHIDSNDIQPLNNLNAGLKQRLQSIGVALAKVRAQRNRLGDLRQATGSKVKATPEHTSQMVGSLWSLCQKQILPPYSTDHSEFRIGSDVAITELDTFRPVMVDGAMWTARQLGSGGQGVAAVFEYVKDGTPINRVVRKETNPRISFAKFNDPRYWQGDTTLDAFAGGCVPMEYHTQKLVSDVSGLDASNTVKLLAPPQVIYDQWKYRLYMEFAPHGDTDQLLKLHDKHGEPIPELFLWLVFQALLNNCMIMKQGGITEKKDPWSEIVYCDMKAENLFLGSADTGYYPQYPTPKLGDFGLAFPTNENDATNPVMWAGRGTRGHLAPEQLHWMSEFTRKPMSDDKMLSPCNVFGIATIMYQLMERKSNLGETLPWRTKDDKTIHIFSETALKLYGGQDDDLCDLVTQCLHSDPKRRPGVKDLLDVVETELYDEVYEEHRVNGLVDILGDTLLVPGEDVKLKWASRLRDGVAGIDAGRVERDPVTIVPVEGGAAPSADVTMRSVQSLEDFVKNMTDGETSDDSGAGDVEMTG